MTTRFPLLLLAFAIVLTAFSIAAAPVSNLSLTHTNAPAVVDTMLDFSVSWDGGVADVVYWNFDSDGNVLQKSSDANLLIDQNFNDGTFGDWNVVSGSWTAANGSLEAESSSKISYDTVFSENLADNNYTWTFDVNTNLGNSYFVVFSGSGITFNLNTEEAYGLFVDTSGKPFLRYFDGVGGVNDIIEGSNGDYSASAKVPTTITRDANGQWELIVDGASKGTAVDTNKTTMESFWLEFRDTNMNIDDVNMYTDAEVGLSSPNTQSHTFDTAGAKKIQVTVQNTDGNASTSLDLNVDSFLAITVWDENAGTKISNATIDFNGDTYTATSDGNIAIPVTNLADGNYDIVVDAGSSYTGRTFSYEFTSHSAFDLNFLLLKTSQGSSRSFTVYQPDGSTLITNSLIEWRNTSTVNNGIAQRTRTDSSGVVNFFGQEQQYARYVMRITDSVAGVQRDYNGTTLQLKIPLNQFSLTQITDYAVTFTELSSLGYTSLTSNLDTNIYSDTTNFYLVTVDDNSDDAFFPTSRLTRTRGGTATLEYQPYLVPRSGNVEATVYTIDNDQGRVSLPDIRIESYTDINGTTRLVESKFSDGSGTALFHFIRGKQYTLFFYDTSGDFIFSKTIEASSTTLFVYLDTTSVVAPPKKLATVTVSWFPSLSLIETDKNVSVYQILSPSNTTIGDINVWATSKTDSNVVFNQFFNSLNTSTDYNLGYDINTALIDGNTPITVHVQIWDVNGVSLVVTSHKYSLQSDQFSDSVRESKDILGQFAVTLISLILTLVVLRWAGSQLIGEDRNSMSVLAMLLTGLFMTIGWIPFADWVSAVAAAIGFTLMGEVK